MEATNEQFKSIYKSELAHLYCPELPLNSALKNLRVWMGHHPLLRKEMEETGYRSTNKRFTPYQVALIYKYLGTP